MRRAFRFLPVCLLIAASAVPLHAQGTLSADEKELAAYKITLQAGMVYGFSQGKVDYAKLPPGINPENVKFVAERQAELQAMQKEFAAIGKRKRQ